MLCAVRYDQWKLIQSKTSQPNQPLTSQFSKSPDLYNVTNMTQKQLENAIVNELIISGNIPLSVVETTWFRNFMKVVHPKFAMPHAKCEALRDKLSSADAVSLTLDMWSDRRMRSYMRVTVHCLSHDMQPETWLLDMSSFTGSYTAEKIGNHCVSLVDDFHVRPKLSYIVTDNVANMLKAFKSMSELFPNDRCEGDELTVEDEDKVKKAKMLKEIPSSSGSRRDYTRS